MTAQYFGVTTCAKCGQKVSMEPQDILDDAGGYAFECKRCRHRDRFPAEFKFKPPIGRDLTVEEAYQSRRKDPKKQSWLQKILSKIP